MVAQGKSNEEIARELYLSLGTVKKQLGNLMLRLCLENRVQAAVYAVKVGLDKEPFGPAYLGRKRIIASFRFPYRAPKRGCALSRARNYARKEERGEQMSEL